MKGGRTAAAGAIVTAASTLALAGWLYAMPPELSSPWGLNHPGLEQFRGLWHLPPASLTAASFRVGFWVLVAAAWTGYGALLVAGARGGRLPWRTARGVAVLVAVAVALGCPPSCRQTFTVTSGSAGSPRFIT